MTHVQSTLFALNRWTMARFPRQFQVANTRYAEYLRSPAWKALCSAVRQRCSNICERCQKFLVDEVHHLTYAHVYNEPLEDLRGLCIPCHRFLHKRTGIDPLAKSVYVKVAYKVIEYSEVGIWRFRRVRLDKLGLSLAHGQSGTYQVPVEVFLDAEGSPIFDPSRWQSYKRGSRIGRHYHDTGPIGRSIPPDPEAMKHTFLQAERRKQKEIKRQQHKPESFQSFRSRDAKTDKELRALLREHPRLIQHGRDYVILGFRTTKTMGFVLDLEWKETDSICRMKLYHADQQLAQGEILLDQDRGIWVMRDQPPLPPELLRQFGIDGDQ